MIVDKKNYSRSWQGSRNMRSVCLVIFILSLISTTNAIKCYICGPGADAPFLESRSSNVNRTFIKQKVHKSCEEFDRIPLEEKYKYEMECPEDYVGCMLNVGASVLRTCSELRVDDCKTVNKGHYCYCHRQLCNGENAESIIEKLGDVNDDEAEENENFDSDEASGSDDEDFSYSSTSRNLDSTENSTPLGGTTTVGDKLLILSVVTTAQPTNEAVTSNLSKKYLIILTLSSFIVRSVAIN